MYKGNIDWSLKSSISFTPTLQTLLSIMFDTGLHLIFSGNDAAYPVGRNPVEDRSLLPKQITVLDRNNEAEPVCVPFFFLTIGVPLTAFIAVLF